MPAGEEGCEGRGRGSRAESAEVGVESYSTFGHPLRPRDFCNQLWPLSDESPPTSAAPWLGRMGRLGVRLGCLGGHWGADWGSNLGPGTPKILNLPNVFVDVHTFSIIYNHPQKPNENTRLSGAPEPKFDPKSVQNPPPGVSGVALSFFYGQHTVSQRQPNKTPKNPNNHNP